VPERIVILGGGISGLAAAYHLVRRDPDVALRIYERSSRVGGLCRSVHKDGFIFDHTGHLLHLRSERGRRIVGELVGDELVEHERSAWIYSKGVYTRYPFQSHTYGLPPEVVVECLVEFIRAGRGSAGEGESFEEWIQSHFGSGIARHFMIPYNHKLWRVHPREMTTDWLDRFVPAPGIEDVVRGAVSPEPSRLGYNATFSYPRRGGIEVLPERLAQAVGGRIEFGKEARAVRPASREVEFADGSRVEYERLISTVPLPELVEMIADAPPEVRRAARELRWVSVLNINLGVARPDLTDRHWIYVPEEEFLFYRVGFPTSFSRYAAPEGASSLYTEISHLPEDPLDETGAVRRVSDDLVAMGILRSSDRIATTVVLHLPFAYVIFDRRRGPALETLRGFLSDCSIDLLGRFGAWTYASMEDCICDAERLVERLFSRTG
jgi:protoporphyrinogen oxidase